MGLGPAVTASVRAGAWVTVAHSDPDALVAAVAGTAPTSGRVLLDGTALTGRSAAARCRAGLGSALGRLPDVPVLRLLDLVLLARPLPHETRPWQAAFGGRRARVADADAEAAARALAGRLGLGGWLDRPAVGLPPGVAALADVARALAAAPRALVWRRPEWLGLADAGEVRSAVEGEQARLGLAVLEVASARPRVG